MILYIVWYENFFGVDEYCGLFSSEEKAQNFIDNHDDKNQMRFEPTEVDA